MLKVGLWKSQNVFYCIPSFGVKLFPSSLLVMTLEDSTAKTEFFREANEKSPTLSS